MGLPLTVLLRPTQSKAGPIPAKELVSQLSKSQSPDLPHARVELLDHGVDSDGNLYAVVGRSASSGWDWDVVVFRAAHTSWKVSAIFDYPHQRGPAPQARYFSGDEPLLKVNARGGGGTGYAYHGVDWYRLNTNVPDPILHYLDCFYEVGPDSALDEGSLSAEELPQTIADGVQVQLVYRLVRHIPSKASDIESRADISFRWSSGKKRFFEDGPNSLAQLKAWRMGDSRALPALTS